MDESSSHLIKPLYHPYGPIFNGKASVVPYINGTYLKLYFGQLYLLTERPKRVNRAFKFQNRSSNYKISEDPSLRIIHNVDKDRYYLSDQKNSICINKEFGKYLPHQNVEYFTYESDDGDMLVNPVLLAPEEILYHMPPYVITKYYLYKTELPQLANFPRTSKDILLRIRVAYDDAPLYLLQQGDKVELKLNEKLKHWPTFGWFLFDFIDIQSVEALPLTYDALLEFKHGTGRHQEDASFIDFTNKSNSFCRNND